MNDRFQDKITLLLTTLKEEEKLFQHETAQEGFSAQSIALREQQLSDYIAKLENLTAELVKTNKYEAFKSAIEEGNRKIDQGHRLLLTAKVKLKNLEATPAAQDKTWNEMKSFIKEFEILQYNLQNGYLDREQVIRKKSDLLLAIHKQFQAKKLYLPRAISLEINKFLYYISNFSSKKIAPEQEVKNLEKNPQVPAAVNAFDKIQNIKTLIENSEFKFRFKVTKHMIRYKNKEGKTVRKFVSKGAYEVYNEIQAFTNKESLDEAKYLLHTINHTLKDKQTVESTAPSKSPWSKVFKVKRTAQTAQIHKNIIQLIESEKPEQANSFKKH